VHRRGRTTPNLAPNDPMPDQLWNAVLDDPRAHTKPAKSIHQCALSGIKQHVLSVGCHLSRRYLGMPNSLAARLAIS
jgi:hypothetical protein